MNPILLLASYLKTYTLSLYFDQIVLKFYLTPLLMVDLDRIAEMTTTKQELYDKMLALYSNRVNSGAGRLQFGTRSQTVI
jgi:hypothetical protein